MRKTPGSTFANNTKLGNWAIFYHGKYKFPKVERLK